MKYSTYQFDLVKKPFDYLSLENLPKIDKYAYLFLD